MVISAVQPYNTFLGSALLESLIPVKFQPFALLLLFIYPSGMQKKPIPSTATSDNLPPFCHNGIFPKGMFWEMLSLWDLRFWHAVRTFGHLGRTEDCQEQARSTSTWTDQLHQHTWSFPEAVDLLCVSSRGLMWTQRAGMSQKYCAVHMETMCARWKQSCHSLKVSVLHHAAHAQDGM